MRPGSLFAWKSTTRVIHRECGRGERKREGGGRTSTSAGLLLCSCPPAGRSCRGAGLHLRLAVRSASSCSALHLPSALLGRPLCHLVLCSAVRSASPLGPGSLNIVYSCVLHLRYSCVSPLYHPLCISYLIPLMLANLLSRLLCIVSYLILSN